MLWAWGVSSKLVDIQHPLTALWQIRREEEGVGDPEGLVSSSTPRPVS